MKPLTIKQEYRTACGYTCFHKNDVLSAIKLLKKKIGNIKEIDKCFIFLEKVEK